MTRRQKDPMRPLTEEEGVLLLAISRSRTEPAAHVERAKLLLAVADGQSYTAAAHSLGRRSNDAVATLVGRFNREGVAAIEPGHGGGASREYGPTERERVLREFHRPPDRERDGTATWSLPTLQRALRRAEDGLPTISTFVILQILHDAGYSWQRDRSWCKTGEVKRKRKSGTVTVTDPDAEEKKR
jgi:transposase